MKYTQINLGENIKNIVELMKILSRLTYDDKTDETTVVFKGNPKFTFDVNKGVFSAFVDFAGVEIKEEEPGYVTEFKMFDINMPLSVLTGNLNSED